MQSQELYRALEFAHYAKRLKDSVTVVANSRNVPLKNLLLDLKILSAYDARIAIVASDPDFQLARELALLNAHGGQFHLIESREPQHSEKGHLHVDIKLVQAALDNDQIPVVVHHGISAKGSQLSEVEQLCGSIMLGLGAKRFVVITNPKPLEEAIGQSRVALEDLIDIQTRVSELGIESWAPRLQNVKWWLENDLAEVVYIAGAPGSLCEELFTHEGKGVLFCRHYKAGIRRAQLLDVNDIMLQLRSEIDAGKIIAIDESGVAENIDDFFVYEIDEQVVATMRIKRFANWAELATGSTLFRDRKKGHIRELLQYALESVESDPEIIAVFGVSIDERIAVLMEPLGFQRIEKHELPDEWHRNYDPDRPSIVYAKML